MRFDYGYVVPWVRRVDGRLRATAGPDSVELMTPVDTRGEDFRTLADFTVSAGETVPFLLRWHLSHEPPPEPIDAVSAVADTDDVVGASGAAGPSSAWTTTAGATWCCARSSR